MTLRSRIAFVRQMYWPAVVGLMAVTAVVGLAAGGDGPGLFAITVGAAVALTVAWRPLARWMLKRLGHEHQRRIDEAIAEGDDETQRRLLDETEEYYRVSIPRSEPQRRRLRCHALVAEERWSEALAVAADIDRDAVPAAERAGYDNLVAWCCAHAGETARAVELARGAVDASSDARLRPYLLGTLGAALVLDGQHAAAQGPLREALALGGPRSAQAVRHYHLGQSLVALGRFDDARAEWQAAVTIAPKSRWGRRAQQRLAEGAPAAYR
jgi:tetratricopeptide (TPR) repeat protein